jgi:imidazolonepropionase-like amidohydrolase
MKTDMPSLTSIRLLTLAVTVLLPASFCSAAVADESDPQDADKAAQADTAPAASKTIVIKGADVHTITNGVIRRGTVVIEDGKISGVGQDLEYPDDAHVVDATGMVVTPGFISLSTRGVGLASRSGSSEKPVDNLDPFDDNVKIALSVGITTSCLQVSSRGSSRRRRAEDELFPGLDPELPQVFDDLVPFNPDFGDPNTALCPCCGLPILPTEPIEEPKPEPIRPQQNIVVKMSAGTLDGMLVSDSVFFNVTPGAFSGGLNRKTWRDTIRQAREYIKAQAEHEKKTAAGEKGKPPRKPVSDDVLKLVKGETRLRVSADSVSAIRDMIELADELEYSLVIDSAIEGWVIPDELARAGVSVVITPRQRRQPSFAKEDSTGSSIELSGTLENAGVPFAVSPLSTSISLNGLAGRDLTSLPLEAAFAVRGGCSERAALEALTIVPARMLKLDDRIGSIEVGKDADLLVMNGGPLDYRTYVETAIVNGRIAYERDSDRVLPVFER